MLRRKSILYIEILFLAVFCTCTTIEISEPHVIEAHKECPLCGMYPARYPRFHCQIVFKDGTYEAFDSTAGLLVYLFFPDKTGMVVKEIQAVYFKDYLRDTWIESKQTYFVFGSDVMGPMGLELLPAGDKESSQKLLKQENGREIAHFEKIDRKYLTRAANEGWLHYLAKKLILK